MAEITTSRVVTGDVLVGANSDYILGHGTVLTPVGDAESYVASVTGVVRRVNKLITVTSQSARYQPEVGDVVVGRVVELGDKRWKVDIHGRQHASLLLSSVHLPGAQRRRTEEDALQMRAFLREGELVSAEVQKVGADRSASLHTRSFKYGKLAYGVAVRVSAALVRRAKVHFHSLPDLGVDVLIGVNGIIFLSPTPSAAAVERRRKAFEDDYSLDAPMGQDGAQPAASAAAEDEDGDSSSVDGPTACSDEVRESIARLRNAVLCLARARRLIHKESILHVYNASVARNLPAADMMRPQVAASLAQHANVE